VTGRELDELQEGARGKRSELRSIVKDRLFSISPSAARGFPSWANFRTDGTIASHEMEHHAELRI